MLQFIKRKKKILILAAIILAVAIFFITRGSGPTYELAQTSVGPVVQEIELTGKLKSILELNLSFENQGQVTALPAKEGQQVQRGQLLAQLNVTELKAKEQEANANLASAQAEYTRLVLSTNTNLENAYASSLLDIEKARLRSIESIDALSGLFETTGLVKSKYQSTDTQIKIDLAQNYGLAKNALNVIRASADKALLQHDPMTIDEALRAISVEIFKVRTTLENARDFIQTLLVTTDVSSSDISTLNGSISTAWANLNTAAAAIVTIQQTIEGQKTAAATSAKKAELDASQAKVDLAKASLSLIRAQIQKSQIIAPTSGVVNAVSIKLGEYANSNVPVITLLNENDFEIEVNIPEADVTKITKDQTVDITFDALGEEKFTGHVALVRPGGTPLEGVIYYKGTVVLDEQDARLKPGMSANINFNLPSKENVLRLPQRAIFERNGQAFVRVLNAETITEQNIRIGLIGTNGYTEILDGISEDMQVVVRETGKK